MEKKWVYDISKIIFTNNELSKHLFLMEKGQNQHYKKWIVTTFRATSIRNNQGVKN